MRLKAIQNFTPPRLAGCFRPKSGDRLTGGVFGRARHARSHQVEVAVARVDQRRAACRTRFRQANRSVGTPRSRVGA